MVVCGDNAAMMALATLRNWRAGVLSSLTQDAEPNAKLGCWSSGEPPVIGPGWPEKPS